METLEPRWLFASVITDRSDYPFGSTAQIDGAQFAPNEVVQLQVSHATGTSGSNADPQNQPWLAQADGAGHFHASWVVDDPDARGAAYVLSATGLASGQTAQATFTDSIAAPVTIATGANGADLNTLLSSTFSQAVPAGNTLIVAIAMDPNGGSVSLSDGKGNVYTKDADVTNGSGTSGVRTLVFSAPIAFALTTSDRITVTFGTPTDGRALSVHSVAGLASASAKDKSSTATGTGPSVSSGSTPVTAQPDELLIGVIGAEDKTQTLTPGANFTTLTQANTGKPGPANSNLIVDTEYRIVSAAGAYAANGTIALVPWAAAIVSYRIDVPSVASIARTTGDHTSAATVSWTVTFNRNVTGVDASDFALVTTGAVAGAGITGVSGSGTTWTVTANTGTGEGTIGLNLIDNDSIKDVNGNSLDGAGLGTGNFTGEVYTIDRTPPLGVADSFSVNEDNSLTPAAPGVLANDTDADPSLSTTLITGPAHAGSFILNADGSFSYTPAANYNGPDSFTYRAVDRAGNQSANTTVSITVTPVNDAPTLNSIPDPLAIAEDAGAQTINLTGISAGGNETQTITITATSNNPSLIPNPTVTYTSPNSAGTLSYTPVANVSGTAIITVTVTDNGGTGNGGVNTITRTFTVNVTAVNDAPSIAANQPLVTVNEGATATNTGTFSDIDSANVTLSASVGTITPSGSSSGTWTWSYNTSDGPAQSQVVTITADDGNGGIATTTFNLTVNNVPPTVSITGAPASSAEGTPITLGSTVSDPGADSFTYAWNVTKNGNPFASGTGSGFSFTPNDNGSYVVTLSVTDDDSGVGSATKTISVTNVNPAPAIIGAPAASQEGTAINLTSSVSDPGSADTFTYAWNVTRNGNPYATGAGSAFTFTPDDDGSYAVTLTVTDDDAGVGSNSATIAVSNVAPAVTITGAPASSAEGTPITLGSIVSDPGADTFTYAWSVTKNGNPFSSGTGASFTFTPNDDGSYAVTLTVTDDNGGVGSNGATITVNNVAPTVSITGAPASSLEGSAIVLGSTISDPGAETFTYTWNVTRYGNPYASGSGSSFTFTPDDDASYVVNLSVNDGDGGVGSDTRTISVANVNPAVAITSAPASSPEGTPISLTATVSDPGSADSISYFWLVTRNGDTYDIGLGSSFTFTPDDDGSYVVSLDVSDDDGGVGSDSVTIPVSNVAPTVSITGAPASSPKGTIIVLGSTVSDPGADTFSYAWNVTKNGNPYASGTGPGFSFISDDDGSYSISLTVTDDDGGVGSDNAIISVSNVAIIGAPTSSPEGTAIVLGSIVSDPAVGSFSYAWSVTRNGNPFATGAASSFSFTPDDDGSYVVSLTVSDDNGAVGAASATISVNNVAPSISITGTPASSAEGTAIVLGSTVADPGGDTITYAWNVTKNGNPYASGTGSAFSFTPDDDGSYAISLSVTDDDGGVGSDSATISVGNVAPTVSITGAPVTSPEGTAIILGNSVSDPGADSFSYAWTVTKNGNPFASGTGSSFSFTPDDDGSYVASLTVTDDDGGVASDSASISVGNVPPSVSITGAPAFSPEGSAIILGSTISDPGADTFTYAWNVTKNGNPYASGAGSSFSFTPDNDGSYVVSLTVTDDDGAVGSDISSIAVGNVAPTVSITGAPASGSEGSAIVLGSTVSDPGADSSSYAWNVTRNGNPYASGTGSTISFTPDNGGSYAVTLTVTDADGGTGSDSATIAVSSAAATVSITGAPASSAEGTLITLGSTVSNPGPAALTYAWNVTKNGNPFTTGAGSSFSFTPDDNGSYVVSLTVSGGGGAVGSDSASIAVSNVAPTATASVPSWGVRGLYTAVNAAISDAGLADGASITWNWGDGSAPETFSSGSPASLHREHIYGAVGNYPVTITAVDKDGASVTVNATAVVKAAAILPDPMDPARTALVVGGTEGDDNIKLQLNSNGRIKVTINGKLIATFAPTGHILIYGFSGRNYLIVDKNITRPAVLYGGTGKDVLVGGSGNDVLIGRRGDDVLVGNGGRDILIGGVGADATYGGLGEDILIGGSTVAAENFNVMTAIAAEWFRADVGITTRMKHLKGSAGGLNGTNKLTGGGGTVYEDLAPDNLSGSTGGDWFFSRTPPSKEKLIDFVAKWDKLTAVLVP